MLDILLDILHWFVHNKVDYRKVCAQWAQRNPYLITKLTVWDFLWCIWHYIPTMKNNFCSTPLQGIKRVSLDTWNPEKNIWHGNTHHLHTDEIKSRPQQLSFFTVVVYFLNWCDTNCRALVWYSFRSRHSKTRLVTGYSAMAGALWINSTRVLFLYPVISFSLDPLKEHVVGK